MGSAMIESTNSESFLAVKPPIGGSNRQKLVFTGDLGNSPEPLINPTEIINDAGFWLWKAPTETGYTRIIRRPT